MSNYLQYQCYACTKKSSETSRVLSLSIIFPRLSAVQSQRLWHWLYLRLPSREWELLPANLSVCAFVHMQTTKLHSITSLFYARESVTDLVNRAAGVCEKGSTGINLTLTFYHIRKKISCFGDHNYDVKRRNFDTKSWNHDLNIYDKMLIKLWIIMRLKSQHCEVLSYNYDI